MVKEVKFTTALTVLLIWATVVYGDSDEDDIMVCEGLAKTEYVEAMCCESIKIFDKFDDELKECKTKGSSENSTCADYECFLKKKGMLADGKIIDDKAKAFLDGIAKKYPNEKEIMDVVKEECLDGLYEEYPPEDACLPLKFFFCINTNVMVECDSWKDTPVCREAAGIAKKCEDEK